MVKSANMNGLLDSDSDSLSSCQQRVKARLHEILQKDRDFTTEDYEKVGLNKLFYMWTIIHTEKYKHIHLAIIVLYHIIITIQIEK